MRAHILNYVPAQVHRHMPEVWPPISDLRSPISVSDLRVRIRFDPSALVQPIRTSAINRRIFHMLKNVHDFEPRSRLLARIVRTLLASETFDSLPDLTEALKCRCAQLRIKWTPDDITEAFRVVESNTPLPGLSVRRRLVERPLVDHSVSRVEAAALLERLGIIL